MRQSEFETLLLDKCAISCRLQVDCEPDTRLEMLSTPLLEMFVDL